MHASVKIRKICHMQRYAWSKTIWFGEYRTLCLINLGVCFDCAAKYRIRSL
jgi:hypothetical protein